MKQKGNSMRAVGWMKQALIGVVVSGMALSASGCGSSSDASGQAGGESGSSSVTYIGFAGSTVNLMEEVALREGIFEKNGLTVKMATGASGSELASGLLSGSAQFGVLTPSATAPLTKQGECFNFLTSGTRASYNIVAGPDVKLSHTDEGWPGNIEDLRGKKVGINARGSAMEYMVNAVLDAGGLEPSDVTYVAVGGTATAISALREGQIDMMLEQPPTQQLMQPSEFKIAVEMFANKDNPLDGLPASYSGTTCDYAKAHPQQITSFCTALKDAYDFANNPANREAMITVLSDSLKIDKTVATNVWDTYNDAWPTAAIDKDVWSRQQLLLPSGTEMPAYDKYSNTECA
ncbi:ABC transporter substrate-binding protein [Rhodococcus sp. WS4]|nr:ABC transporter substrate-binding protein [Rhodococcus sp. WS4]